MVPFGLECLFLLVLVLLAELVEEGEVGASGATGLADAAEALLVPHVGVGAGPPVLREVIDRVGFGVT